MNEESRQQMLACISKLHLHYAKQINCSAVSMQTLVEQNLDLLELILKLKNKHENSIISNVEYAHEMQFNQEKLAEAASCDLERLVLMTDEQEKISEIKDMLERINTRNEQTKAMCSALQKEFELLHETLVSFQKDFNSW